MKRIEVLANSIETLTELEYELERISWPEAHEHRLRAALNQLRLARRAFFRFQLAFELEPEETHEQLTNIMKELR